MIQKQQLICNAINEKKVIRFTYKGTIREVEPFLLGILESTDNLVLSGYKISGFSESNNAIPWRLYNLIDITTLTLTDKDAKPSRLGYNKRDERFSKIICKRQ